jgi:hypothetical protein
MPEYNCVIAVTSNADMGKFMKLIWSDLLPAIKGEAALPQCDDYHKLAEFVACQSHMKVNENTESYPVFRASYKLSSDTGSEKDFKIKKIGFNFENGECLLALYNKENSQPIYVVRFTEKKWVENTKPYWEEESFFRAVCYGEWNHEEFSACIWHYETPLNTKLKFSFSEDRKRMVLQLTSQQEMTLNYVKI